MTLSGEITRIQTNIANAYEALNAKGATIPQTPTSDYLADTIATVPQGGGGGGGFSDELEEIPEGKYRVRFFDYDGELLSSTFYNLNDEITAPEVKSHPYLTFDRWTYGPPSSSLVENFSGTVSCVGHIDYYGSRKIPNSVTNDILIKVKIDSANSSFSFGIAPQPFAYADMDYASSVKKVFDNYQSVYGEGVTITIDWGDNTANTVQVIDGQITKSNSISTYMYSSSGNYISSFSLYLASFTRVSHTYAQKGEYWITINVTYPENAYNKLYNAGLEMYSSQSSSEGAYLYSSGLKCSILLCQYEGDLICESRWDSYKNILNSNVKYTGPIKGVKEFISKSSSSQYTLTYCSSPDLVYHYNTCSGVLDNESIFNTVFPRGENNEQYVWWNAQSINLSTKNARYAQGSDYGAFYNAAAKDQIKEGVYAPTGNGTVYMFSHQKRLFVNTGKKPDLANTLNMYIYSDSADLRYCKDFIDNHVKVLNLCTPSTFNSDLYIYAGKKVDTIGVATDTYYFNSTLTMTSDSAKNVTVNETRGTLEISEDGPDMTIKAPLVFDTIKFPSRVKNYGYYSNSYVNSRILDLSDITDLTISNCPVKGRLYELILPKNGVIKVNYQQFLDLQPSGLLKLVRYPNSVLKVTYSSTISNFLGGIALSVLADENRLVDLSWIDFSDSTSTQIGSLFGTPSSDVGSYYYNGCSSVSDYLYTVKLPVGMSRITSGNSSFIGSSGIGEIQGLANSGLTVITNSMFQNCSLDSLEVPDGFTKVGYTCVGGSSVVRNIRKVWIPSSVTSVAQNNYGIFSGFNSSAKFASSNGVTGVTQAHIYTSHSSAPSGWSSKFDGVSYNSSASYDHATVHWGATKSQYEAA